MGRATFYSVTIAVWTLTGLLAPDVNAQPGASEYVRTQSGKVRCTVTSDDAGRGPAVICEASSPVSPSSDGWENDGFLQAPLNDYGAHWHNAVVRANGEFDWADANIGGAYPEEDIVLAYGRQYDIQGWTILSNPDGTRFTHGETGHGMFVSIENVYAF